MVASGSDPGGDIIRHPMKLPPPLRERFEIERVLLDEGERTVAVVRTGGGERRLLKWIRTSDRQAEELGGEYALLAGLRHPCLTTMLEFGTLPPASPEGGVWLLREYVDGPTWAEAASRLGPDDRRRVVSDVASALSFLHRHGLLHCDVKPENVLLTRCGDRWRAVLSDFGLARRRGDAPGSGVSGTPPYVSPEALLGLPLDARSDLFALGAAWALSIEGAPAVDLGRLFARFPRSSFVHALDLDLAALEPGAHELLARLLASDPEDRPRRAADVVRELAVDEGLSPDAIAALLRPELSVRGSPLDEALTSIARTRSPGVTWIRAASAAEVDAVVARATYLVAVAGGTSRRLVLDDSPAATATSGIEAVTTAMPSAVERAIVGARRRLETGNVSHWIIDIGTEEEERGALAVSLIDLAAERRDPPSIAIVSRGRLPAALEPRAPDDAGWLVAPRLDAECVARHMSLLEGADELVDATRDRHERLAAALIGVVGSDPLAIEAALVDAWRRGKVTWERDRFDFSALAPSDVRDVCGLAAPPDSPATLRVLTLLSMVGGALAPRDASLLETDERGEVTGLLRDGRLIRDGDGLYRLRERRFGEAARERSTREDRARIAARIADSSVLSRLGPLDRVHVLILSGRESAAADLLESRTHELHLEEARHVLNRLGQIAGDEPLSPEVAFRIDRVRARFLVYAGRNDEAAALYERLAGGAGTAVDRSRMLSAAGAALISLGRYEEAEACFEHARRLLRRPRTAAEPRDHLAVERGIAFARAYRGDLDGAIHLLQRALSTEGDAFVTTWRRVLLGTFALRAGRRRLAAELLERGVEDAAGGDAELLAVARTNLASLRRLEGRYDVARSLLEEARAFRQQAGHLHEETVILGSLGLIYRDQGELDAAAHAFEETARRRRWLSDRVEEAVALANLASVELLRARHSDAMTHLDRAIETFRSRGTPYQATMATLRRAELLLAEGELEELGRVLAGSGEPAAGEPPRIGAERGRLSAELELAHGRPERALAVARDAARRFDEAGDLGGRSRCLLLLARIKRSAGDMDGARRELEDAERGAPPVLSGEIELERARIAAASGAVEEAVSHLFRAVDRSREAGMPRIRALALAEATLLLADPAPDRAAAVARELPDVLRGLRSAGHDGEDLPGRAVRWLGTRLASALDMAHANEATTAATGRVTTEGVPAEVFRAFIAMNRRLLRESDQDRLLERLLEHGVDLSGARRGFLVLLRDGRVVFETRSEDVGSDDEMSRSIVLDAIRQGRPLLTANAREDQRLAGRRSIEELDLRSVLCVPFKTQNGTDGALYVDNPIRAGAFTERTVDLLEALAGQAAIAIDHLERRDEVERLNRSLEERVVARERELVEARRRLVDGASGAGDMVFESDAMGAVMRLVTRVASSDLPVLVTGESGTGKELLARAVHAASRRAHGPFVAENCSAVPETLLESEFFGHVKGAFTGADRDHEGLFARADRGTLFLDEIGDMPLSLQAKLLRVLQEGIVRPVGSSEERRFDVRLVCATLKNLTAAVTDGTFREDLYYRIRGATVRIPALRDRVDDIACLTRHFLARLNERHGTSKKTSRALMRAFVEHDWPGNVRELQSEVTRLYHLAEGDELDVGAFEPTARPSDGRSTVVRVAPITEIERDAIVLALKGSGGNREEAARRLGISRAAFYVKLNKYDLADVIPPSRGRRASR